MKTANSDIPKITHLKQFDMAQAMTICGLKPVIGKNIICPFPDHNDHGPSFKAWKRGFKCFSIYCAQKGNAVEFVRIMQGFKTRIEAKTWVCKTLGIHRDASQEKRDAAVDDKLDLLRQFWGWCRGVKDLRILEEKEAAGTIEDAEKNTLKTWREVYGYLESRGFDRELCELHDVRCFHRSFKKLIGGIPESERDVLTQALKDIGMISTENNFLFNDRIIFPLTYHGQIVSMTGRTWRPGDIRSKDMKYAFPRNVHPKLAETLYLLDEHSDLPSVYMTEGPTDTLTLVKNGIPSIAICGTSGLTQGKLRALKRSKIREIIIVFDFDSAETGQVGAMKTGKLLFLAGLAVKIKFLPPRNGNQKNDINQFFQDGGTIEQFKAIPARDWFDLFLDQICISPSDPPALRNAALKEAYDLVGRLPKSHLEHYVDAIIAKFPGIKKSEVAENIKEAHTRHAKSDELPAFDIKTHLCHRNHIIADGAGTVYQYDAGVYRPRPEQDIGKEIIQIMLKEKYNPYPKMIADVLSLIKTDCFIPDDKFNPPGFLNCQNKLVNLETGAAEDHRPDFISTVQLKFKAVGLPNGATESDIAIIIKRLCRKFLKALKGILPSPADRRLLQMIFGYLLIPTVLYQVAFLWLGEGENGKSTLAYIANAMLGDENCSHLFLSDLKERFRLAQLQFKLLNIVPEVRSAELIDDGLFKALISGDPVTIEKKYQKPTTLRNFAKFIIMANNPPKTRDFSHGLFRRLIVIPFTQRFEKGINRDDTLLEKIIPRELPGILLWSMQGLQALRKAGGFPETESTLAATSEYRLDVDPVYQFLESEIDIDITSRVSFTEFYAFFSSWCARNGVKGMSSRSFGKRFLKIIDLEKEDRNGTRYYLGIKVKDQADLSHERVNSSACSTRPFGATQPKKVLQMRKQAKG